MNEDHSILMQKFSTELVDALDFLSPTPDELLKLPDLVNNNLVHNFKIIGSHNSDSLILKWIIDEHNSAIVWLDSEGFPNCVFAPNEKVFLSYIPYGLATIYDIISSWIYYYEDDEIYENPSDFYDKEFLNLKLEENSKEYSLYNELTSWLKNNNIPISEDIINEIGFTIKNHPNLDNWLVSNT